MIRRTLQWNIQLITIRSSFVFAVFARMYKSFSNSLHFLLPGSICGYFYHTIISQLLQKRILNGEITWLFPNAKCTQSINYGSWLNNQLKSFEVKKKSFVWNCEPMTDLNEIHLKVSTTYIHTMSLQSHRHKSTDAFEWVPYYHCSKMTNSRS